MDSIFRDRLLRVVTHDNEFVREVIDASNAILKAENKKELEDAIESFILAMMIYLIWLGRGYAEAMRDTLQALYGFNIPPFGVQRLVTNVLKKHRVELEKALRAGTPIIDKVDWLTAMTTAVVTQAAMVVGSTIVKQLLPQGQAKVKLDEHEAAIIKAAETGEPIDLTLATPVLQTKKLLYRYVHTRNMEGICQFCAPHVGKITTGDGSDDVPVPPLHKFCRCVLLPLPPTEITEDMIKQANPIQYLSELRGKRLAKAIGPTRAALVEAGELKIENLFEPDFSRLKSLKELGYSLSGKRLKQ